MTEEISLSNQEETFSPKASQLPSLLARIKAVVIDLILLLIVFSATSVVTDMFGDVPTFVRGTIAVVMLVLYDPLLTAFTGGTIGHKLIGIRVKKYAALHENISFVNAVVRFTVKSGLGWLSFLTVTSSKDKRAIHDSLSGSIVLR